MGLEADGDSIHSFNFSGGVTSFALGIHARNRGAGYVDLDLRPAKKRWSLSAGAREEIFSGGAQAVFSPELAGSFRVANSLKLRASGGYGFRIPTYTDLYYSDPIDTRQSQPQAGVGLERRRGRGLDAVGEALALVHRLLLAPARHHRLRKERHRSERVSSCGLPSEHLVRRQPERAAFCGRRIHADVDSEEIAEGAHRMDRFARRESALHGLDVGVRLQLPGPEHSCLLDLGAGPRFRSHQRSANCRAIPANGVSGVERRADARHLEAAAVSAGDESEQYGIPGDQWREHAAANDHGRGCAATRAVKSQDLLNGSGQMLLEKCQ